MTSFPRAPWIIALVPITLWVACASLEAQNLSVLSVSPTSNVVSAPVSTSISVTFDRPVDPTSVTASSFWAFGRWTLHVLLSNGDGTFTSVENEPGVSGTWMLALGDLNGDGHIDVTSANSFANTGSVSFGNGDGTLSAPTATPADPFTIATDLGDLDGDGDLDWVTSSFSGDWLVWLNNGSGGFALGQEILAPTAASCATLMDIDGDGDLDLALIDEIDDVTIIQRNGPPASPTQFIRGDSNGDGSLDIADAIGMLGALFGGGSPPACRDANDANDDGTGDISDPITVLAHLFSQAASPPPPYPSCGPDPSVDPLDCVSFTSCP